MSASFSLPSGFVTFCFMKLNRDVPDMDLRHFAQLTAAAIGDNGGFIFKQEAGVALSAFRQARQAVTAAFTAMNQLNATPGLAGKVRTALHSGEAMPGKEGFSGRQVETAFHLLNLAPPGHIFLSLVTQTLVKEHLKHLFVLRDLGLRPAAETDELIRVFELAHPDLPGTLTPIRTGKGLREPPPLQLTSFVGRREEVETLKQLLGTSRLLTLVGPGGIGKTRLALEVAAEVAGAYRDGAWLADLSSLAFPELVPQALAAALDVREQTGQRLSETLASHLKSKQLLLVADNCEHLISAAAELCRFLLSHAPGLRILATSQQPLGLEEERTWSVPPLQTPNANELSAPKKALENEAARLFLDRIPPSPFRFQLNPRTLSHIKKICRKLEGIPLAIELAAARVGDMTPQEISSRIEDSFSILSSGERTGSRHETLRDTIRWSYNLLSPQEQILFRRLSVFSGGFSDESAEGICAGNQIEGAKIRALLDGIARKSLCVVKASPGATPRYHMLEIVRQYAASKLQERMETEVLRGRHANYFVESVEKYYPGFLGPEQEKLLNLMEEEHDNLRKALSWFKQTEGLIVKGLQLAGALSRFWVLRGYVSEGMESLSSVLLLAPPEPTMVRARALLAAGILATEEGEFRKAESFAREGLAVSREIGFKPGVARILNLLGILTGHHGRYQEACEHLRESLDLMNELEDKPGAAAVLINIGAYTGWMGNYEEGRRYLEESLALAREAKVHTIEASCLANLGLNALLAGESREARALLEEGLALSRQLGYKRIMASSLHNLSIAVTDAGDHLLALRLLEESVKLSEEMMNKEHFIWYFFCLGRLAAAAGKYFEAAEFLSVSDGLTRAIEYALPIRLRRDYENALENLRVKLGAAGFVEAWEKGKGMPLNQAIARSKEFKLAGSNASKNC